MLRLAAVGLEGVLAGGASDPNALYCVIRREGTVYASSGDGGRDIPPIRAARVLRIDPTPPTGARLGDRSIRSVRGFS